MAELKLLIIICLCLWVRKFKAIPTQDPSVCVNPPQRTLCGGTSFDVHTCSLKNGNGAISYINLKEEDDGTTCTFYDGAPEDVSTDEGSWGIDETILWTKGNCRGIFEYCTTEEPFCEEGHRMVNIQFCLSSGGYNPCDTYSNKQLLITRAEVVLLKPESNKTCNFWNGNYMSFRKTLYSYTSSDILHREGSFGYYGGTLWMDLGCKAEYRVCVLDNAVCRAPKRVGHCEDEIPTEIPRFYYNQETDLCEEFNWSGCNENRNNFETKEECETACLNEVIDECGEAPCQSGGTCIDTPNSYYCECLNNGWSGKHCDDSVCKARLQTVVCGNPNVDSTEFYECRINSGTISLVSVRRKEEFEGTSCTFYDGPHQDVSTDQSRWGFTADTIWVKGNCGGIFEYCSTVPTCDEGIMQTISCDSFGEHQVCQIGEDGQLITSVEVVHVKSSDHSCYFWHGDYYSYKNMWFYSGYRGSYGFIGRKVWVDRECRAEFKVCLSGGSNDCSPNPCQNGAECESLGDDYQCNCPDGFNGKNCDNVICDPEFCGDHGLCNILNDALVCECSPGYKGDNCEEDVNECQSRPCDHLNYFEHECENVIGNYTCACNEDGWTGQNCDKTPCTGQMQTVQCYSGLDAYDTTHCELGVNGSSVISLRVVRVQWDPPCNFKTDINYTRVMVEDGGYGFDDNIMWSADGCTGIFEYCLELPQCHGEIKTVDCQSWYQDEYIECPVTNDGRYIVYASVIEKYSDDIYCNYRTSFNSEERGRYRFGQTGFIGNKVWVYNQCRVKLEVCLSVMHNLELEANKLYDRANKLCKVALMTMYYVLHFTSPYIYSVVNHIDITCNDTIPFNNKANECRPLKRKPEC